MIVRDLMTSPPVTVAPTLPVNEVVALLLRRGMSGVPVVDANGSPVGFVTEADLLRRLTLPKDSQSRWYMDLFDDHERAAHRYVRASVATVCDVMTTTLWTVQEDSTVGHAARMLEEYQVRRLPVVRSGRLVGMVGRADLLRALLPAEARQADAASDETIRIDIAEARRSHPWARAPRLSFVVRGGVVEFRGYHSSASACRALYTLILNIPGVRRIVDNAGEAPPGAMQA